MKKTILTLIIGILIGAIIATGIFLVIRKSESSNADTQEFDKSQMMQDGNFVRGDRPNDGEKPEDAGNSTNGNATQESTNTI